MPRFIDVRVDPKAQLQEAQANMSDEELIEAMGFSPEEIEILKEAEIERF